MRTQSECRAGLDPFVEMPMNEPKAKPFLNVVGDVNGKTCIIVEGICVIIINFLNYTAPSNKAEFKI